MRHKSNEGFLLNATDLRNDIFIPRYYDPRIAEELEALSETNHLVSIDTLVADGKLQHDHGSYIPKIYYGAGPVPYIRTSDIANWEIKASPKHGIPLNVYEEYTEEQDVRAEDILFVHEGTYLIGAAAMVTKSDGPLLYQHHLAKFRVLQSAPFDPYFFLAALESPPIQRQIRSKQFSADIIDSVVGRIGEVVVPYPKDKRRVDEIAKYVKKAIVGRAEARETLSHAVRRLDDWLQSENRTTLDDVFGGRGDGDTFSPDFLGYRTGFLGFTKENRELVNDILLPKYYDPGIAAIGKRFSKLCDVVSIGELRERGLLALDTGDEIGRMNYGTGDIPFVRTSDLASWELKRESKQGVSEDVYTLWQQGMKPSDILLIRDGTYLVGSSVLLFEADLPLLYCGGIYRVRSLDHNFLHPSLLFGLLNLPFVRRQMRNKQFTRDIIDTIGRRIDEVLLPVPKSADIKRQISTRLGKLVGKRSQLRAELTMLVNQMYAGN